MYIKTENFKLNASGKQFSSLNVLVWRRVKSTYVQFVLTIIVCVVVYSYSQNFNRRVGREFVFFFVFIRSQLLIILTNHTT